MVSLIYEGAICTIREFGREKEQKRVSLLLGSVAKSK
jgi:hypothetical protein